MKDRSVEFPNRYRLEKVAGTSDVYDLTPVPGEVNEEGSAVNKSNFLPDSLASALGLSGDDPQVKDALDKLRTLVNTAQSTANGRAIMEAGSYKGTGTDSKTIYFSMRPDFVAIVDNQDSRISTFITHNTKYFYSITAIAAQYTATWTNSNTLQITTTNGNVFNSSSRTISWFAVGK